MPDFEAHEDNARGTVDHIADHELVAEAKPGDFVLRDGDLPIGYLYSTQVNLDSLVGKRATLIVTPRPNNNFAFPAYYVLSVE